MLNALTASVALLLFAGVAGAVVKPGDEKVRAGDSPGQLADGTDPADSKASGSTSSTAPTTVGAPTTAASKPSGTKTTTGGKSAPATRTPNPATTWTPPKDGKYIYKTEGDEDDQEVTFKTIDRSGGEVRQSTTGQFGGGSGSIETVWNAKGYYWERLSGGDGTTSGSCDFQPPLQLLAQPMSAGATWSFDSRCVITFGAESVEIRIYGTSKVVKADLVQVGDTVVDVWVVERATTTDFTYNGKVNTTKATATESWAPAFGLNVASTRTDEHGQSSKRTLESLEPK